MKAVVYDRYGPPDVLHIKDVPVPVVRENEVLVRVHAASLNAGDVFSMRGHPWVARLSVGFPRPKDYIPGWDMAGRIEAVGNKVTNFRPGDEVFGACGHTFAEYVSAAGDKVAPKPRNLTFRQAGAAPTAAITALQLLRDVGGVKPGAKVLINGASGGVGTFAVQIAKTFGAEVTGVCSTRNMDMVKSLGAGHVIDYTGEDFTRNGLRYDLILDNVSSSSFTDLRRVIDPKGKIIPNSGYGGMKYVFKAFVLPLFVRQMTCMHPASSNYTDLTVLKELIESGAVMPVIDRTFPLSRTADAFRHMEENHARGKIVITIIEEGNPE